MMGAEPPEARVTEASKCLKMVLSSQTPAWAVVHCGGRDGVGEGEGRQLFLNTQPWAKFIASSSFNPHSNCRIAISFFFKKLYLIN